MLRRILLLLLICSSLHSAEFNIILNQLLDMQKGQGSLQTSLQKNLLLSVVPGTNQAQTAQILVFGKGSPDSVNAHGGTVQTIAGEYFTALVPLDSLKGFKDEKRIEYMEYGPVVSPKMDIAGPYVDSDKTYNVGYKGDGVIIGMIDTGIDINHPDFTTENGLSRILYIWDQTVINPTVKPPGFSYGREWSKFEIDNGVCKENDTDGHGTHTSGIAAGNGNASGGRYRGISPNATIIFVKVDQSSTSYFLDAINYIFKRAQMQGKPCVINISFGTHSGSHTALDPFNLAVDSLLDSYGRKGRAIVWAAGNEGMLPIHNSSTLSSSGDTAIGISYYRDSKPTLYADFWYTNIDYSVSVMDPNGVTVIDFTNTSKFSSISTADVTLSCATVAGEKRLSLSINSSLESSSPGWRLIFQQNAVTATVDGYITSYDSTTAPDHTFTSSDFNKTISSLACQKNSIAVGSILTRPYYDSLYVYGSGTQGEIATYSSWGPSRDSQNKPEISAPGGYIIAPLSSSATKMIKVDSSYAVATGTSMAAPAVTGIIAQMLEKEPYLTSDDIKTKLIANSKLNSSKTSHTWDKQYGYGIADLYSVANSDASTALLDVWIKNNVMNTGNGKDNQFLVLFRSNSSQIGKSVSVKIYDKNANLIWDFGSRKITGVEVKDYVWKGHDQFGRIVQPGLYFAIVTVDNAYNRYPILVVR